MADARRSVLRSLVDMNALAMLNAVDDDADLERKREMLHEMVDANEEWLLGLLDGMSDEALSALVWKRVTKQAHVVEVSKLFDKVGIDNHVCELLKVMVPGHGYDVSVDDNVRLPRGVRPEAAGTTEELVEFVKVGAINWIDWFLHQYTRHSLAIIVIAQNAGQTEVLDWARKEGYGWPEWQSEDDTWWDPEKPCAIS